MTLFPCVYAKLETNYVIPIHQTGNCRMTQVQEKAMLQVLMRVEKEQKEKYEDAITSLAQIEKRVVMAESMPEATLQYQSRQVKVQPSPRAGQGGSLTIRGNQEAIPKILARKISLFSRPFGLGWWDKNKEKPSSVDDPNYTKPTSEAHTPVT